MSHDLNLVADVGGTNTRVALADGQAVRAQSIRKYANADHEALTDVLATYHADAGTPQLAGACVAMAGPVRDGVATLTNLDWSIDRPSLGGVTGAPSLAILNDLQAQAHAVGALDPSLVRIVVPQPAANAHAAKLVVGVGTGFNAAPVYDTDLGRFVPPSECGHISLPVWDEVSLGVALSVAQAHGFAAIEEILSGRGIGALHTALCGQTRTNAQIMQAVEAHDPDAMATLSQFIQTLGVVVGDLTLTHLPFGGVYLCGGVARRMAPYFEAFGFVEAMRRKGRFTDYMGQFGVAVIEDDFAALTGCAAHLTARAER